MGLVTISQTQVRVPVTVFQLHDRVTIGNFAQLEQAAREAFDNGMRNLIIDLSETSVLTSIGVRALVVLHRMLSEQPGKHLKVACPTPEIRDMLDISGVTQYIEIYSTLEDAVASF